MTALAPDLFDTDFAQLLALAHARLPQLAPGWTDYNLHDPGIMLIELLAWVTEAQIYSVARVRTDERWAFGALLGMAPHGPLPASGMAWPTASGGALLARAGSKLDTGQPQVPAFRLESAINITAATLTRVTTRLHGGGELDHTAANARGDIGFAPFGPVAGPHDALVLSFTGNLLVSEPARDACLAMGVRVAGPRGAATACITATLVAGARHYPMPVRADGTGGLLRSGVMLLALHEVPDGLDQFDIVLTPADVAVAPRILCIRPNVLPMRQGGAPQQVLVSNGMPGQAITLDTPGASYPDRAPTVTVEFDNEQQRWPACANLTAAEPDHAVHRFDADRGRILFGNGINGRIPPAGATITVDYDVSEGAAGNLNAGSRWILRGGAGHLYTNLDATSGGAPAFDLAQLRRQARASVRDEHAIVTAHDLETAALALPGLDVARVHSVAPDPMQVLPAAWVLVAMRGTPPETPHWLAHVQRALAPRVLLGERLQVRAPDFLPVAVTAILTLRQGVDPAAMHRRVIAMLADYFRLVERAGGPVWPLGRPVRVGDLKGWLLRMDGVTRVVDCSVSGARDVLALTPTSLPLFQPERSSMIFTTDGAQP